MKRRRRSELRSRLGRKRRRRQQRGRGRRPRQQGRRERKRGASRRHRIVLKRSCRDCRKMLRKGEHPFTSHHDPNSNLPSPRKESGLWRIRRLPKPGRLSSTLGMRKRDQLQRNVSNQNEEMIVCPVIRTHF